MNALEAENTKSALSVAQKDMCGINAEILIKKCLNCGDNHSTLAMKCPKRKEILKEKKSTTKCKTKYDLH